MLTTTRNDALPTTRSAPHGRGAALTRAALVESARTLFVSQGYRATSLRDIASEAGVSHPGLLRHFATKDALLAAVVAELDRRSDDARFERAVGDEPGALGYAELATYNERVPGYLPLFAALTGEASSPTHPAHAHMRDRYAQLRVNSGAVLTEAIDHGLVSPDRDVHAEAVRLAAAWDGMQVLYQYLPVRVDIAATLAEHERLLAYPFAWREGAPRAEVIGHSARGADDVAPGSGAPDAEGDAAGHGNEAGRVRRAKILAAAAAHFIREGYGDTSLAQIAAHAGVTKATLLHHYSSKDALLTAVLAENERALSSPTSTHTTNSVVEELRSIAGSAASMLDRSPDAATLHAVLSCEATTPSHPAHEYFRTRYARLLDDVIDLFERAHESGALPSHRTAEHEALWFAALVEGVDYQWLYDRGSIDVGRELREHLDDLFPEP